MNRGYYTAAQGMINQQRILDAISNNVANVNTAGYKADQVVLNTFQEQLFLVYGRTETSGVSMQTYVDATQTDLTQGMFEYTESRFDAGIYGDVYFNVRYNKDNTVYQTRNGQWKLDDEGYLCLGGIGRVQGENGDIFIGSDDFIIHTDGRIETDNGIVDRLLLSYIPPDADINKIGDTLFSYDGDMTVPQDAEFRIIQGAFEKANVDAAREMTRAIEAQRMYEATSKILQYFDKINQKSATEIAKI